MLQWFKTCFEYDKGKAHLVLYDFVIIAFDLKYVTSLDHIHDIRFFLGTVTHQGVP